MEQGQVEIIQEEGLHLATVIRHGKDGSSGFYTPASSQFQVGVHFKPSGAHTKAHYYARQKIVLENPVQEIMYVESGRLIMSLYDMSNTRVAAKVELGQGDVIILAGTTAHGADFIENTKLIEIKQGPYQTEEKVDVE